MKFYKILTMAAIAAISASFISCNDDEDGGWTNGNERTLPTAITIKEGDNTEKISFKYGTEGNDTTRITQYTESESYGSSTYSSTYTIVYTSSGQVASLERDGQTAYTYTLVPTPRATGVQYATLAKKDADGNIKAYITINSNNQLVSYVENDEDDSETTLYTYSDKNIKSVSQQVEEQTVWTREYSYSKYNGIFKNVSTPQWFLASEFDNFYSSGHIQSAVSKAKETIRSSFESTFTYNSEIKGFPTKFTVKAPYLDEDTETIKTGTEEAVVSYNISK